MSELQIMFPEGIVKKGISGGLTDGICHCPSVSDSEVDTEHEVHKPCGGLLMGRIVAATTKKKKKEKTQ